MSSHQARRHPAEPSPALPLRSFTGLWVLLAIFGLAFVVFATRGLVAPKGPTAAERSAAQPKGPTKEQVRERQEHIALTERALELARKERAAQTAPAATTATQPSTSSQGAAPAAPATSRGASPVARAAAKAEAPATATPAAPVAKPAAASGLDEMRADITSAFE